MSTTNNQKQAARQFVQDWSGKGYEKGETQRFWIALLHDVLGVENPVKFIEFEIPVKTITKEKGSDYIDGYISSTKVLIEQKGSHVDLSAKARQSDGAELTPYQQGRRYAAGLPQSQYPRWIVAWPQPTDVQKQKIEQTAQAILEARDLYPDATFADMYGNLILFPDLLKVHRANDAAVLEAYGFPKDASESDIVARLFKLYQELTKSD